MITNQRIEETFILQPLFFKWVVVFRSFLECFSIVGWTFMQNTSSSSLVFICWCLFLTIFELSSLQVLENALAYTFSSVSNWNNLIGR